MVSTAIVTGANGFIGSRIVLRLLEQGWMVHAIGRGKGGLAWGERLAEALCAIPDEPLGRSIFSRLVCSETNLNLPDLGLSAQTRRQLLESSPLLIHVAGDTRFTPSDPGSQRRVNVDATLNVLRTLGQPLSTAVHVSTAYVAGDRPGPVMETDFDLGQDFRNHYEQSKLDAELAARDLCAQLQIPLVIVRPSIVINDTQTGRSSTFTHLNALIEVINRIQEHYGLTDGAVVSKVIRLLVDPGARPNMIPVDPMVDALLKIAQDPRAPGKAYHLCHPMPQSNSEIVDMLAEAIGIKGKLTLSYVSGLTEPVSHTEKMIVRSLRVYLPYMNGHSHFDLSHTRALVPGYAALCPKLDLAYLEKVIRFQRQFRAA